MTEGLASISLTHVYFNPQDKVSYAFAYITLAPIAILVFYASVVVSRREMAGIFMLLGQLINEAVNAILKSFIKQERPHGHLGDGYGMPSSHSQFIWFFAVYSSLYLLKRIVLDNQGYKILLIFLALLLALLVSISRVYLGYHTTGQVLAGTLAGSLFAVCWYTIVTFLYSSGCVDFVVGLPIAKKIYLKDMSHIDNVAKWEYLQWEQKSKKAC